MESRRRRYHIVTPFWRRQNEEFLRRNTEGFVWHRVEDAVPGFNDPAYAKINWFIANHDFVDDDRYMVLMDDDALPDGFLEECMRHEEEIVIFSLARGDRTPPEAKGHSAHPTSTLTASRENMRVGFMGLQQIMMSGRIFRGLRCEDTYCADGLIAESLRDFPGIRFVPEVKILFNYLEPGRWAHQK